MSRDYRLFLKDIVEAINSIEEFTAGMSLEEFAVDDKTSSAVLRKLEIIGEAAKNIPEQVKKEHPDIPWKDMARIRDKVSHSYFIVDHEIVWKVVKERLSDVKQKLDANDDPLSKTKALREEISAKLKGKSISKNIIKERNKG
jgi:uncharacterized protein with HEPN domain